MKRKFKSVMLISMVLLIWSGCGDKYDPSPVRIGAVPPPVTSYVTEPMAGGARITYELPDDQDLRYVKAVFHLKNGVKYEAKSSLYNNYIVVEGFPEAGEYNVTLVAVGVGEVESAPTTVKIQTLTPPYIATVNGLRTSGNVFATYGGININYENTSNGNIVIHVLEKETNGQWKPVTTVYTKQTEGAIKIRGYQPDEQEFGVYVTDRWNNISDTVSYKLTPLREELIDKSKFVHVMLPGDTYNVHPGSSPYGRPIPILWNDDITRIEYYMSSPGTGIPQWFTFDAGQKVSLSRVVTWTILGLANNLRFDNAHIKSFELWGTNELNPDGSWDNWTKVGAFTGTKPSGLPRGQVSAEDLAYLNKGEEYEVEPNQGAYRYWRWKTTESWGGVTYMQMSEFSFYGQVEP